jgi:hypothetical protein
VSYASRVLADSISPDGVRLTTLLVTFPRFILAEVNTHRMLSRNSASSRAIPTEKLIERVRTNPFVPETFNKRVKGMGVGAVLESQDLSSARAEWLMASENAAAHAEALMKLDVDKSRANRLLEPFMWHTAIISATEWDNFFALRDHPAAQPEFQIVAKLMRASIEGSTPLELGYDQWHLPLITFEEWDNLELGRGEAQRHKDGLPSDVTPHRFREHVERIKLVSAGRCARVSFDTHENWEPWDASEERAKKLMTNGHFSPFEHVARPFSGGEPHPPLGFFVGNFRGWVQMRKEIPHEDNFALVGHPEV